MPAPCTIVTLVDEDGDEFPVFLPGQGYQENQAFILALHEAEQMVDDKQWFPNGAFTLSGIEER